jgi:hypothetical protein
MTKQPLPARNVCSRARGGRHDGVGPHMQAQKEHAMQRLRLTWLALLFALTTVGLAKAQPIPITATFSTCPISDPGCSPGVGGISGYSGVDDYTLTCGKKTCTDYEGAFLSGTNALSIQLSSANAVFGAMPFAFGGGGGPVSADLPDACKPGNGFQSPLDANDVDFRFYVGKKSRRGDVNVPLTELQVGTQIDGDLADPYHVKGVVNFWASETVYLSLYYNHSHDGTHPFTGSALTLERLSSSEWHLTAGAAPVLMECRVSVKGTMKVYTAGTYSMPFTLTATIP